jgi:hypothetical protein
MVTAQCRCSKSNPNSIKGIDGRVSDWSMNSSTSSQSYLVKLYLKDDKIKAEHSHCWKTCNSWHGALGITTGASGSWETEQ